MGQPPDLVVESAGLGDSGMRAPLETTEDHREGSVEVPACVLVPGGRGGAGERGRTGSLCRLTTKLSKDLKIGEHSGCREQGVVFVLHIQIPERLAVCLKSLKVNSS